MEWPGYFPNQEKPPSLVSYFNNSFIPIFNLSNNSYFNLFISSFSYSLDNIYNPMTIGKVVDEAYSKHPVGILFNLLLTSIIIYVMLFI